MGPRALADAACEALGDRLRELFDGGVCHTVHQCLVEVSADKAKRSLVHTANREPGGQPVDGRQLDPASHHWKELLWKGRLPRDRHLGPLARLDGLARLDRDPLAQRQPRNARANCVLVLLPEARKPSPRPASQGRGAAVDRAVDVNRVLDEHEWSIELATTGYRCQRSLMARVQRPDL